MILMMTKTIFHFARKAYQIENEVSNLIPFADFEFTDSTPFSQTDCNRGYTLTTKRSLNYPVYHCFCYFIKNLISCLKRYRYTDLSLQCIQISFIKISTLEPIRFIFWLRQASLIGSLFYNYLLVETGAFPL